MSRFLPSVFVFFALLAAVSGCGGAKETSNLTELQRAKSGDLELVMLSPDETLAHGKDDVILEFRKGSDLVDVGTVKVSAMMAMAGMSPMLGSMNVTKTDVPGRYAIATDLGMAGSWQIGVQWDGPAGKGSVTFPGSVQ